jgi:hypothetical protein
VVKLLVPKHAGFVAARSPGHKKQAGYTFALQHRKHVRQRIHQAVVAGDQNSSWRKLLALLYPRPKVLRANHIEVRFEELELPSKHLRLNQISIEKNLRNRVIGRNNSVVIHDRITGGRHNVIEPSDLMQSRIYRVLQ